MPAFSFSPKNIKARLLNRRLGDPNIPDEEEFEFLTGKDPEESERRPGQNPGRRMSYPPGAHKVPIDDTTKLLEMDLNSLIPEVEEVILGAKEALKNPNLSTRSKKLDAKLRKERNRTKSYFRDYIIALEK
jgi:hypothetical protein